jgi:hypothetical protein
MKKTLKRKPFMIKNKNKNKNKNRNKNKNKNKNRNKNRENNLYKQIMYKTIKNKNNI